MKTLDRQRVAIIGGGTMGSALLAGLLARGIRRGAVIVADPSAAARRRARGRGVRATPDSTQAASRADVVILAVKPQEMDSLLAGLAGAVTRRQLVISIAAGVTLRRLQAALPRVPVVRAMPNLAATVGRGFAAYAPGRHATGRHRAITRAIFEAVGQAVELPERQLDAITAVSGSGPAYLFVLAQACEAAARRLGLPQRIAERAVRQTLAGAIALLQDGGRSPQAWIAKVASKRGTTEAALKVLARGRVATHIAEAVRAAARRSRELSCS